MTEKEHFFWNKLLELAKEELTQATFDYYVLDTKLIKVQDNVATILLEEVKKLFWEKNMQSFILMAGFEAYNSEIKVEYVFDEALINEANPTEQIITLVIKRNSRPLLFLHWTQT